MAVLADMMELGEETGRFHREVGRFAAGCSVDCLVCVGKLAEEIGAGFLGERAAAGRPAEDAVRFFASGEEALPFLKTQAGDGNLLLLKGSNAMKLSQAAAALRE